MWILSKHFEVAEWVALQRNYLDAYVDMDEVRLFSAEGIDGSVFEAREETVWDLTTDPIRKLDELAALAMARARPHDWLLFLDSDAFPVAELSRLTNLGSDLVAVQRTENEDFHPHPCFTLVRAQLWSDLEGDWGAAEWVTPSGSRAIDMGRVFLDQVTRAGIEWIPMQRINLAGLHPLWFGLYGLDGVPFAYHHGAGSRTRVSRSDALNARTKASRAAARLRWLRRRTREQRAQLSVPFGAVLRGDPQELDIYVMASIRRDFNFWMGL